MKKIYLIVVLFVFGFGFAQAPQKMSYQAVVRDANGNLVVNTAIGEKISILSGSVSGTAVYVETHTTVTNANGLMSIEIGGGAPQTGTFAAINWANGLYFVKTETDPNGGSNYSITGTSQLLSVPYALYAENTKSMGRTSIFLQGDITDAQAAAKLALESGPFTENIYITNTTQLTTVSLPNLTSLVKVNIVNNAALATVNFDFESLEGELKVTGNSSLTALNIPSLKQILGVTDIINNPQLAAINLPMLSNASDRITITNCNSLTALSLPLLVRLVRGIYVSSSSLQSVDIPLLQTVVNGSMTVPTVDNTISTYIKLAGASTATVNLASLANLYYGSVEIYSGVSSLNVPVFQTGGFIITNSTLTSLTAPSFTSGPVIIKTCNSLTSVSLPALINGHFEIFGNATLSSISIPSFTSLSSAYPVVYFSNNNFPSTMVNYLLSRLVLINPSSKTFYLKQIPPAPPTGQGLVDKAFLLSHGNTVFTD